MRTRSDDASASGPKENQENQENRRLGWRFHHPPDAEAKVDLILGSGSEMMAEKFS